MNCISYIIVWYSHYLFTIVCHFGCLFTIVCHSHCTFTIVCRSPNVYHSHCLSFPSVCNILSFPIVCHSPLSVIFIVIFHRLSPTIIYLSHCLSFPLSVMYCYFPLSTIHHYLLFTIVYNSPLSVICHCHSPVLLPNIYKITRYVNDFL